MVRLDLFATDAALAALEGRANDSAADPEALVALAWHLRERDPARTLALAAVAESRLASAEISSAQRDLLAARLHLLAAERARLAGCLPAAREHAAQARHGFAASDEPLGCADCHWSLALTAIQAGDHARRDEHLAAMVAAAAADPLRVALARTQLAIGIMSHNLPGAGRDGPASYDIATVAGEPALSGARMHLRGLLAGLVGNYADAIGCFTQAYRLALETGQILAAVVAATHVGRAFICLNDHQGALEWMELGLALAKPRGWPFALGIALAQTAETLRRLRYFDAAQAMLSEALETLAPIAASRAYAGALTVLGELALDRQQGAAALAAFEQLAVRAQALGDRRRWLSALRGQAAALLQSAQPQAAAAKALEALTAASANPIAQIEVLRLLAKIHEHPQAFCAEGQAVPTTALDCLLRAAEIAARCERYTVPDELLEELAHAHARAGDTARAFDAMCRALEARKRIHGEAATRRASALRIGHETEKARAEAAYQRSLAQARAERLDTLEKLGRIGREITGNLAAPAIFAALDRHVHALLDAYAFLIYRLEGDERSLQMVFRIEGGRALPLFSIRLDEDDSLAARCARERREIVVHVRPGEMAQLPGTTETLSNMFAPLLVGERLLGVMVIATPREQAYGEREVAIFSTLCAYAAIALANAEAQAQLIQAEKLASLGQLVASVAHEINTPIAAVKSSGANIAGALDEALVNLPNLFERLDREARALFIQLLSHVRDPKPQCSSREERAARRAAAACLAAQGIAEAARRADLLVQMGAHTALELYLPLLRHAECELILGVAHSIATVISGTANINTAVDNVAKIVFALKSYSRVDHRGELRPTPLREGIETVLTLYHNQIKHGVELVQDYEDIPPVHGIADELNQVWTNLIHNALQAMNYRGTLTVRIRRESEQAVVAVADTGCGIPEAYRARIFDPFFTSKPKGEGSGLGLDIVRKIVDKHQGRIEFASTVGVGTTFCVYLPFATEVAA